MARSADVCDNSCDEVGLVAVEEVDPGGDTEEEYMQAASVSTDARGDLVVVLRGDIDFTNSPGVLQVIREKAAGALTSDIRVDLSKVTFMDSSGISVLVQLLHLAEERGVQLHVERPGPKVQDQLSMSGLAELFDLGTSDWPARSLHDHD
jgi:anti-sigma B factor antagonist